MKKSLLFLVLSMVSFGATAGKSFGCIWAEAKLETAIKMQKEYKEKQYYYVKENGKESLSYQVGMNFSKEDEREARGEVNRKCD